MTFKFFKIKLKTKKIFLNLQMTYLLLIYLIGYAYSY